MIIVVGDGHSVEDLTRTLRSRGYVLVANADGVFELRKLKHGRSVCEICDAPAAVWTHRRAMCAKHAQEFLLSARDG